MFFLTPLEALQNHELLEENRLLGGAFVRIHTLHGTHMEVKNGPLEDPFPLQTGGELHFRVSFRECICFQKESRTCI